MAYRLWHKIEKVLATFFFLFCSLLVSNDLQSAIARQVDANLVNISTSSLPPLSERANGVNSRYLSAAGTASLAAATVAASNTQSSSSNSNQATSSNGNNNQLEANRNFLQHQQQHLQHGQQNQQPGQSSNQPASQQQQVVLVAPQSQANVLGQSNNQPVQTPILPQFNNAQYPQNVVTTPLMSTSYTFNPLANQFVPLEMTTSSILTPSNGFTQQQLQATYNAPHSTHVSPYNQQQHRFGQQQTGGYGAQSLNQIINQQRQLNRRNSYLSSSPPNRQAINNYGQTIDDDGYFQLQQTGNDLNSNAFNPLNEYNFASSSSSNNNNPFIDHLITPQSSSVSNLIASPIAHQQPSISSFSTAFSGSPALSFEYKNDQCVAADGRHGTCYQASECIKKNGTPMGKCNGGSNSNEFSGSSYVCCLFDVTCGSFAAERFVYFRNPNYPNTFDQSQRMCRARIGKLDKGICQFRLDLNRFDVAKPTNGNCSTDMFVVSGQNENYIIPKICGLNDGQHYYVGVDESGIITLHMMMMGYYRRNFEIMITQIPCRSDYSAPAHCLQYYMGTHGTIKSFNYNDEDHSNQQGTGYDLMPQAADQLINQGPFLASAPYGLQLQQQQLVNGATNQQLQQRQMFSQRFGSQVNYASNTNNLEQLGYPNDLDYTMCIRKESGFCSITYQLSRNEQGVQPFAIGHSHFGNDTGSAGWQPVSTECRDDYLLIGGVRLCTGGGNNQLNSNQYPGFDTPASIQFSQNGSILNAAGVNGANNIQFQQQQLQSQYNSLLQQLARLQQQQLAVGGNNSTGQTTNQQANLLAVQNGNSNIDQQQAAIIQQTILVQQQLNQLANQQQQNNRYQQQFETGSTINSGQQHFSQDSQGTIITDTTPGPFILRFVSNLARNARGFHIDYRQNPCK